MELGLGFWRMFDDEGIQFAAQLGVKNIRVNMPDLPGDGFWDFMDLLRMRTRVEAAGLKLFAIENVPRHFDDKTRLGLPGRDEQIENYCKTIRNMGRAGIHILGYYFGVLTSQRTECSPTGRGGAWVDKYDHELVKRAPVGEPGEISEETMWANYAYFLKAVIPVAEQEGVVLALHPDDPPVPSIGGQARIFCSTDAWKRAIEMVPSPSNCLDFCQGTVSEWCETAEQVYEAIRYFGSRGKIAYVHFRDVRGRVPKFEETFIDEGKVDMLEAMRIYKEVGFEGVMIVDHSPRLVNDTRWAHRGRAYAIGYMKALMQCVNS